MRLQPLSLLSSGKADRIKARFRAWEFLGGTAGVEFAGGTCGAMFGQVSPFVSISATC